MSTFKYMRPSLGRVELGGRTYFWYDTSSLEENHYTYRLVQRDEPYETAAEISLQVHNTDIPWSLKVFGQKKHRFAHLAEVLNHLKTEVVKNEEMFALRRDQFREIIEQEMDLNPVEESE